MKLNEFKEIINSIFSESGFSVNGMTIQSVSPTTVVVTKNPDNVNVSFISSAPLVTIKKLIKFKLKVTGITFGEAGGIIHLQHFPDMHFSYEKESSFSNSSEDTVCLAELNSEIDSQYSDDERRKLAKQCLHYVEEWATIVSNSGFQPEEFTSSQKKALKKQCCEYVKQSFKSSLREDYGSAIAIFLLLNIVLPMIIKWVVERAIKKLFD